MKKRLTEAQFRDALRHCCVGQQTIDIARGVLVEGRSQVDYCTRYGVSRGAVSQAVNRVWRVADIPAGHKKVTAVLPKFEAFVVKRWETNSFRRKKMP